MIDTHCHLYDEKLYDNLDVILENAKEANINKMICIGDNIKTSKKSIEISKSYDNIYATVGIHPHEAKNAPISYLSILEKCALNKKVVAIGEIGLDYYYNISNPEIQKKIFFDQLELSKKMNLPSVVHCRDAYDDLYETILKSKNRAGVIHCFSGSVEFAKKIIDLGFYISFTGMITFVKELENVIQEIELKHMMVETDSPYLAPIPYRGKTNQPAYVNKVAEKIAEIKNLSIDEVEKVTTNNANILFHKLNR